jgi:hypothetical protein
MRKTNFARRKENVTKVNNEKAHRVFRQEAQTNKQHEIFGEPTRL